MSEANTYFYNSRGGLHKTDYCVFILTIICFLQFSEHLCYDLENSLNNII